MDRLLRSARARPKDFRNNIKYIFVWINALAARPPEGSASHKRPAPAERSNENDNDDDDNDNDDDDDDGNGDDDNNDADDIFVLLNQPHQMPLFIFLVAGFGILACVYGHTDDNDNDDDNNEYDENGDVV